MSQLFLSPFLRPLAHGSYLDEVLFGAVFLLMAIVFLYFYFSGSSAVEDEPDSEEKT
jgi:hypothetical protein